MGIKFIPMKNVFVVFWNITNSLILLDKYHLIGFPYGLRFALITKLSPFFQNLKEAFLIQLEDGGHIEYQNEIITEYAFT